jgi:hypothetical protein
VSTSGQTLDGQVEALEAAGATVVLEETASGARTDRAQLAKAIAALRTGDKLIVTRLDRVARSTRDLLNTLDTVAKKGAMFKSLADAWADTTTPHGRLMLTLLDGFGPVLWTVAPDDHAGAAERGGGGMMRALAAIHAAGHSLPLVELPPACWTSALGRSRSGSPSSHVTEAGRRPPSR